MNNEFTIRTATMADLDAITEVEAICFPPAEAAGRESIKRRLEVFANHFYLLFDGDKLAGFINGMATNERTIRDAMFDDANIHDENGAYFAIFGVDTLPEYRRQGCAARVMEHVIEKAREEGRRGLILTCKDRLIHYYAKFGYRELGVSASVHGGAVWYDMILEF